MAHEALDTQGGGIVDQRQREANRSCEIVAPACWRIVLAGVAPEHVLDASAVSGMRPQAHPPSPVYESLGDIGLILHRRDYVPRYRQWQLSAGVEGEAEILRVPSAGNCTAPLPPIWAGLVLRPCVRRMRAWYRLPGRCLAMLAKRAHAVSLASRPVTAPGSGPGLTAAMLRHVGRRCQCTLARFVT